MTPPTSNTSSTMSQELSEEKLREILDGCESVTPGPWLVRKTASHEAARLVVNADDETVSVAWFGHGNDADAVATAAHIARLDPQTVAALVTQVLSLQRKNEELVRALPLLNEARERSARLVDFLDGRIEPLELSGADEQVYAARWDRYRSANQALTDVLRSISEEK